MKPKKHTEMKNNKWYAVPPYMGRHDGFLQWIIADASGELIAVFESREDCEAAVMAYNQMMEKKIGNETQTT